MLQSNSNPNEAPSTPRGWTPSEISRALGPGGKRRIARRAGVTDSAVGHVAAGRCRSRRIQGMIAQAVHAPVDQIFPVRKEDPIPDLQPVVGATPKGAAA